jgi:uncharacterized alkaline shock family protein YloU
MKVEEGQMEQTEQEQAEQPQQTGKTTISDSVVAKIAEIAAREIEGVHELGGAAERVMSGAISKITGGAGRAAGVSITIEGDEVSVDINMIAEYGSSIPEITNNIRQNVMNQVQTFSGMRVKEVNIYVNDLHLPGEQAQMMQAEQGEG